MIEMKVVKNVILNKIDLHDQPFRMHRSPPRSRQNFPDSKNAKILNVHAGTLDIIQTDRFSFVMTLFDVLKHIKIFNI